MAMSVCACSSCVGSSANASSIVSMMADSCSRTLVSGERESSLSDLAFEMRRIDCARAIGRSSASFRSATSACVSAAVSANTRGSSGAPADNKPS